MTWGDGGWDSGRVARTPRGAGGTAKDGRDGGRVARVKKRGQPQGLPL
ncbi:MAG: hypothetical protein FWH01_15155 [Oscillospiraceae bacterium]|nr:hypothetical protein [Oscillospiraceae bacterium]